MTKQQWFILLVSAFTDMMVAAGTALMASMTSSGSAALPSRATVIVCMLGGLLAAARTVQQHLKATESAMLRANQAQPS